MVYFVGAGPGAVDLITVRGQKLLAEANTVVYAGSLVNKALLDGVKKDCALFDSASMTLEETTAILAAASKRGETVVRLHTGDPSLYGAVREQMDELRTRQTAFEIVPGVSSFCAAAAGLQAEYTLPGVSQTVILTRLEGRTPVPAKEELSRLAAHHASMVIFLSAGLIDEVVSRLITGGYPENTKAALCYKVSWADEKIIRTTVAGLKQAALDAGITKTALILAGDFLGDDYARSCLYDPAFEHTYRKKG